MERQKETLWSLTTGSVTSNVGSGATPAMLEMQRRAPLTLNPPGTERTLAQGRRGLSWTGKAGLVGSDEGLIRKGKWDMRQITRLWFPGDNRGLGPCGDQD